MVDTECTGPMNSHKKPRAQAQVAFWMTQLPELSRIRQRTPGRSAI